LFKHLHIIAFDIPFPANYGGVIDVFYKLKALHQLGVKVHLHCFYEDRTPQTELNHYCESVNYYPRQAKFKSFFSRLPFVVQTRNSKSLLQKLADDNYPILFEGLHSTYPLLRATFKNRKTIVRVHNVEHTYYQGLANSETNWFKKLFFKIESQKLKSYQSILKKATFVLSIAPLEQLYFKNLFQQTHYIPVFHQNNQVKSLSEKGVYAYYVGDLRIADNRKAALFLISVFKNLDYPLVIASSFNNQSVENKIKKSPHIRFVKINAQADADALLADAHLNVMLTFQNTGIKLKLINTLFAGRFCLTNSTMVKDTGLESLCGVANTLNDFKNLVKTYKKEVFTSNDTIMRERYLADFNPLKNAQKLIDLIWD